jgi:hypothetical protein
MIRNFKALGLAVVAMLAMSAIVASAAQAEATTAKFTAQDGTYPESFSGTNTAGNEVFTTEGGSVECDSSFSGSAAAASQTVEAHPVYTNCKAFGFLNATVTTTGCNYLFHITTKLALHKYQAHVDVVCTGGAVITIVASTCEATVGAQTGLTTVDLETMTNKAPAVNDITVTATIPTELGGTKGIKYTVTKDGFLCPFGGTGAKTGGGYESKAAATITSAGGIHIG